MRVIALGHRRNVGKDTIGAILCRELNLKRVSFAEKLKDTAYDLFSWAGVQPRAYYEENYDKKEEYLPILDMTYRDLLILLGNKIREINKNTWAECAIPSVVEGFNGILITDLRYPNEAAVVHAIGGMCLRIDRDVQQFSDVADSALAEYTDWDGVIRNDFANLEELEEAMIQVAKFL